MEQFFLSGKVVTIKNFVNDFSGNQMIIGNQYQTQSDLYTIPSNSTKFDIYCVESPSPLQLWPLTDIKLKCFFIPTGDGSFGVFPLVHLD